MMVFRRFRYSKIYTDDYNDDGCLSYKRVCFSSIKHMHVLST